MSRHVAEGGEQLGQHLAGKDALHVHRPAVRIREGRRLPKGPQAVGGGDAFGLDDHGGNAGQRGTLPFKKMPEGQAMPRIGKRIVDGPDRFDGNEDGVVPRRARFRQAAYGLVADMSVFVVGCGDLPVHGGKRLSEPQGDTRAEYGFVLCGERPAFRERPVAAERDHIRGRPHQRGRVPAVAEGQRRGPDDAFLRQDFRNRAPRNQRQRLRAQIDRPEHELYAAALRAHQKVEGVAARAVPCRTARSVMLTPTPRLRDSARTSASARMPPEERRSSPLISINGFMPPPAQCPG